MKLLKLWKEYRLFVKSRTCYVCKHSRHLYGLNVKCFEPRNSDYVRSCFASCNCGEFKRVGFRRFCKRKKVIP